MVTTKAINSLHCIDDNRCLILCHRCTQNASSSATRRVPAPLFDTLLLQDFLVFSLQLCVDLSTLRRLISVEAGLSEHQQQSPGVRSPRLLTGAVGSSFASLASLSNESSSFLFCMVMRKYAEKLCRCLLTSSFAKRLAMLRSSSTRTSVSQSSNGVRVTHWSR